MSHTVDDIKHGPHRSESAVSAEQLARNILERMDVENAQTFSAGDVVELANLIADREALSDENERLRQELAECNRQILSGDGSADRSREKLHFRAFTRANNNAAEWKAAHEALLEVRQQDIKSLAARAERAEAALKAERESRDADAIYAESRQDIINADTQHIAKLEAALAVARKDALLAAERLESIVAPMAHPEFSYSREVRKQIHLDIIDEAKILRALAQKEEDI